MILSLKNYEYELSSDKYIELFNEIVYHLITCDDEGVDYHEIELDKDVENVSFTIGCSCDHLFKEFDTRDISSLEDDDKESILNFIHDINTSEFREEIYEKREVFQIKQDRADDRLRKTGSPTISYLEF
jgi:hypothetical protein